MNNLAPRLDSIKLTFLPKEKCLHPKEIANFSLVSYQSPFDYLKNLLPVFSTDSNKNLKAISFGNLMKEKSLSLAYVHLFITISLSSDNDIVPLSLFSGTNISNQGIYTRDGQMKIDYKIINHPYNKNNNAYETFKNRQWAVTSYKPLMPQNKLNTSFGVQSTKIHEYKDNLTQLSSYYTDKYNLSSMNYYLMETSLNTKNNGMLSFYPDTSLMIWQIPPRIIKTEMLHHKSRFKLGRLLVSANGCIRLEVKNQLLLVDTGVPIRTLHYIFVINSMQRSSIHLGRLSKRIVVSSDLQSLIHSKCINYDRNV